MYAIAYGQMFYEIKFIGPFTSYEAAMHYAENELTKTIIASYWIVLLQNAGDAMDYVVPR